MEKHQYYIRINPYAVALVDEGCPQQTIDALLKMSELVLKTYEDNLDLTEQGVIDKSSLTSKAASGEDGLVNLLTSPSLKTKLRKQKKKSAANLKEECKCIRYINGTKWYSNGCKIHPDK